MECLAESAHYGDWVYADSHFGLELCCAAGNPADGTKQGKFLQADALAYGNCYAVRHRVLYDQQLYLWHGAYGLLADGSLACAL